MTATGTSYYCALPPGTKLDDTPLANVDFPLLWQQINNIEADLIFAP